MWSPPPWCNFEGSRHSRLVRKMELRKMLASRNRKLQIDPEVVRVEAGREGSYESKGWGWEFLIGQ